MARPVMAVREVCIDESEVLGASDTRYMTDAKRWFASSDDELVGVVFHVDSVWSWTLLTRHRGALRPILFESDLSSEELAVHGVLDAMGHTETETHLELNAGTDRLGRSR